MPPALRCPACDRVFEAGPEEPWRCVCEHPLEFECRPTLDDGPPDLNRTDTRKGLWTFAGLVPIERRASLGEGWTPLVDSEAFDCAFKLEYVFPTGSFKDRGAATTVSRAVEVGAERVIEDSSGNAGAAIAAYAARAGLDAEIYVPEGVKQSKLRAIERTGATVERVAGNREAVTTACIERVESGAGWYASHAWNPAFYAGTETMAFEIAADRGWQAPDTLVCPLGHGTQFLGAYRGFEKLLEAGWIDSVPRLYGAQAAGYDPIVQALDDNGQIAANDSGAANEVADGIRINAPARRGEVLRAIEMTGGGAIAVGAATTERTLARLHRQGFYTEPTCAVAPAALDRLRTSGEIGIDEDVVVSLTGSGLKT
jgi:threonine synthase